MTTAGSLLIVFLLKKINVPSRSSSQNDSARVVEIVLLPNPATACNQRMFSFPDGVVSQSVMNFRMTCRVLGRHSGQEKASIRAAFRSFRLSFSAEINTQISPRYAI
jgi:hypothetical protein